MENLKKVIKNYIRENYVNENVDDLQRAKEALDGIRDQNFLQALNAIESLPELQGFLIYFIEFLNKATPTIGLTKNTAIQAIQNAENEDFISSDNGDAEPEIDVDNDGIPDDVDANIGDEEEEVEEVSTSAGAGSYNTKYAFRLKKQKDK